MVEIPSEMHILDVIGILSKGNRQDQLLAAGFRWLYTWAQAVDEHIEILNDNVANVPQSAQKMEVTIHHRGNVLVR